MLPLSLSSSLMSVNRSESMVRNESRPLPHVSLQTFCSIRFGSFRKLKSPALARNEKSWPVAKGGSM